MHSDSAAYVLAQKITKTAKSSKFCYKFNINDIFFNIVNRSIEMMQQQRVSCSGSRVIERTVGEWRQSPPLVFVVKDILSTCCNKNNVM